VIGSNTEDESFRLSMPLVDEKAGISLQIVQSFPLQDDFIHAITGLTQVFEKRVGHAHTNT
jgi:hypothetical protein